MCQRDPFRHDGKRRAPAPLILLRLGAFASLRDMTENEIAKHIRKQLLTYLRLTDKRLGLLINFNVSLIKDGISRVVNSLPE